MRRQFLGYLSGDAGDDLRVARFAKLAQDLRGSDDDEPVEKIGVSMAIERFRDLVCKTFLRDVMPVDLFHRASCNCRTCGGLSGTVRPLLTRRRIILFENLLDDQIDIKRAASVTQEKSLLTIADENETVMGNDVGARRGSMEFSFRNHLRCPKCEWFDPRYAAVRPKPFPRQRFHDGENVTQAPPQGRLTFDAPRFARRQLPAEQRTEPVFVRLRCASFEAPHEPKPLEPKLLEQRVLDLVEHVKSKGGRRQDLAACECAPNERRDCSNENQSFQGHVRRGTAGTGERREPALRCVVAHGGERPLIRH